MQPMKRKSHDRWIAPDVAVTCCFCNWPRADGFTSSPPCRQPLVRPICLSDSCKLHRNTAGAKWITVNKTLRFFCTIGNPHLTTFKQSLS